MNKSILTIAALLPSLAFADYQTELELGYEQQDTDGSNIESSTIGATAKYHFAPIDTSKGPLAEAEFLDKTSYVAIGLASSDIEFPGLEDDTDKTTAVELKTVLDEKYIFSLSAMREKYKDRTFDTSNTSDHWGVSFGTYLNDSSTVDLSIDNILVTSLGSLNSLAKLYKINYKSVSPLSGESYLGWNASVGKIDVDQGDDTNVIEGGVDWYLSPQLSIGADLSYYDSDDFTNTIIGLNTRYFVNENVSLTGKLGRAKEKYDGDFLDGSETTNTAAIEVAFRF